MWTWRDLSWPIIGIFFWWLAGRSLEGLLFSRHKISAAEDQMVGGRGFTSGVGLRRNLGSRSVYRSECAHRVPLVDAAGCIWSMWVVLGASTSLAYFVQWRLRKATQHPAPLSSPNADIYQLKSGVMYLSGRAFLSSASASLINANKCPSRAETRHRAAPCDRIDSTGFIECDGARKRNRHCTKYASEVDAPSTPTCSKYSQQHPQGELCARTLIDTQTDCPDCAEGQRRK